MGSVYLEGLGIDGITVVVDFTELKCEGMDWIRKCQDRSKWGALVNTSMQFGSFMEPNCILVFTRALTEQLSDCWLLKTYSAPWNYVFVYCHVVLDKSQNV
jgi:hypothetical protein